MAKKQETFDCEALLKEWCHSLLKLQIKGTGNERLDGAILCPACGRIHGRCADAMYPFLWMAGHAGTAEERGAWITAAKQLFDWQCRNLALEDGSFYNDIDSDWRGTTVFFAIQLADCLFIYGELLDEDTREKWMNQLDKTAECLYAFDWVKDTNINYPVSNALALYECAIVLGRPHYKEKAKEFALVVPEAYTENDILFGEGHPRFQKSRKGCRPVDLGYNVEESLPALALYGLESGETWAVELAEKGMRAHLPFFLPDGAWNNSFGTRNFKWTYWGSRTSDGCALGYLALAEKNPAFAEVARRNLMLLKDCTVDGLLMGGPHYEVAGQPPCVHHTFTHVKVLAGILDRGLEKYLEYSEESSKALEKIIEAESLCYYPEMDLVSLHTRDVVATVTGYDWEYMEDGHTTGGTLSLLHHKELGPLFAAGMCKYVLKEPNNMQRIYGMKDECLALRIDAQIGNELYSSMYEDQVKITWSEKRIVAEGVLRNSRHEECSTEKLPYRIEYEFEEEGLRVKADISKGILICPVISRKDEAVSVVSAVEVQIKKNKTICIQPIGPASLPYGTNRIFSLIPGLQALRIDIQPRDGKAGFYLSYQAN